MNDKLLKINYERHKLANGLEVILYQDKSLPIVAVNIWYRVGSANESKGKTGFAHLFEHMMFQGSKHIPKGEHFRLIQEAGGSLNGSTSFDRTNYYETIPSNYLELALWLESDRMGFLLPALTEEKLNNQKDVVMNERRQRYENQPYGLAWEILLSNLFAQNHPYSWPTIGWMEDIKNFKLDDVINFFKTYYSPNNATLVIGGNFEFDNAIKLVEKYFGEFPSNNSIPEVKTPEQKLEDSKKIIHEDNVQLPRIYLAWHSDKIFGNYDASLDILSDILTSSKNSRLTKSLVYDKQIAQDVNAFQYSGKYAGMFLIISTAKPEILLEEIKKEIFEQINFLIDNGISDEELIRSKNSIKSHYIYSLQKLDVIVDHINHYNFYLNEPDSFMFDLKRYENVTKEDVIETARKFLANPYVELNIIPKKSK
ncbi:MAG: pitrilysin family protein [Melioribacter sp.]|uniref:M16 family metallopeptidase n=1 Tax=Rosettibacter primus TaxID=3111523 RepID=UPI00247E719B|nr:pitrilysin family protein [Melioribacter sp.]